MATDPTPVRERKQWRWLTPTRVALLGAVVVAVLLTWPISTLGPGDHEQRRCGNALGLNLEPWRGATDGDYFTAAYRDCTAQRVDRLVVAVAVMTGTGLLVTVLLARGRRPDATD